MATPIQVNNGYVNPWTDEEDDLARRLIKDGFSLQDVADQVGRSYSAVKTRNSRVWGQKIDRSTWSKRIWESRRKKYGSCGVKKYFWKDVRYRMKQSESQKARMAKSGLRKWVIDCSPSPELSYIAGAVMGDGTVRYEGRRYLIELRVTDYDFAYQFSESVRKLNKNGYSPWMKCYKLKPTSRGNPRKDIYYLRVNSWELYDFLKDLNKVKELARQFPKQFLRGFADAEGCVDSRSISIGQKNRKTLEFCKELLESLGIKSHVYSRSNGMSNLRIFKRESIKFASIVGFSIKRKQEKLSLWDKNE